MTVERANSNPYALEHWRTSSLGGPHGIIRALNFLRTFQNILSSVPTCATGAGGEPSQQFHMRTELDSVTGIAGHFFVAKLAIQAMEGDPMQDIRSLIGSR